MSTINAKVCANIRLGTGLPECLADLGYPKGFILTPKSWSESVGTTIDKAYVTEQVQRRNFIPFLTSSNFEQNTPDPTTQEFADGEMVVVRNGKPQFTFQFIKTIQFQKIAWSYNSYKAYNVILVFDNDRFFMASDGTNLTGFSLSMLNAGTYNFNTGSEFGFTPIQMQLNDENQFNSNGAVVNPEYDITNDIVGVIDTTITGTAATAGDAVVSVVATANPSVNILGLGTDQFRLVVDGTAEAVTAVSYDDVANQYSLTPTNAFSGGESVVVELYDSTLSVNVANLNDQLYAGASPTITVS